MGETCWGLLLAYVERIRQVSGHLEVPSCKREHLARMLLSEGQAHQKFASTGEAP